MRCTIVRRERYSTNCCQRMFGCCSSLFVDYAPGIQRAWRAGDCDDAEDRARRVINCERLSKHVCRNGSMQPGRQPWRHAGQAASCDLEGCSMSHRRPTWAAWSCCLQRRPGNCFKSNNERSSPSSALSLTDQTRSAVTHHTELALFKASLNTLRECLHQLTMSLLVSVLYDDSRRTVYYDDRITLLDVMQSIFYRNFIKSL